MLKIKTNYNNITTIFIKGIEFGVGIASYELKQDAMEGPILKLQVSKSKVDFIIKNLVKTELEYIVENWVINDFVKITVRF